MLSYSLLNPKRCDNVVTAAPGLNAPGELSYNNLTICAYGNVSCEPRSHAKCLSYGLWDDNSLLALGPQVG